MKPKAKRFIHEYTFGPFRGKFRKCTSEEVDDALATEERILALKDEINKATAEIKKITKDCDHPVCYDTAGHPYDVRHCVICGHTSLI